MSDQDAGDTCALADRGRGNDNAAEVDAASLIWANYAIAEALVTETEDGDWDINVRGGLGQAQRAIARMLCDRLNEAVMASARKAAGAPAEPEPPRSPHPGAPRLVVDNA